MKHLNKIHSNFSLNGCKFKSINDLLSSSESISEGVFLFLIDWFHADDFIVVQTSGSTGKPKTIKIKKEFMVNSALATGDFFNLKEDTTALLCLSPNYIAGKIMLVRALVLGWHLDVVNPSSHPLDGHHKTYDFCAMIPLQVQNSLLQLDRIKTLIIGGAAIDKILEQQLQKLKTRVFATYGMTETVTHIAVKQLNNCRTNVTSSASPKDLFWQAVETPFKDSFKTLPNVFISKDKRGCLVIKAPKISDAPIITNDLVDIIDSQHFKWLGRYDTIINSGGIKIIPEMVEQKLENILLFRFFITGLSDKKLGEKVTLVCEGKAQSIEKLQIEKVLSKYENPKQILFVEKFVETNTHKINRKATLKLI
ncbi:MAG: AMP-binding protein [Flavobacteriales bacterium]|nr:AMP-binding protein [Flavobacteriales bacterium]